MRSLNSDYINDLFQGVLLKKNVKDKEVSIKNIERFKSYIEERIKVFINKHIEDIERHYRIVAMTEEGFKFIIADIIVLDQFIRTLSLKYNDTIGIYKSAITIILGKLIIRIIKIMNVGFKIVILSLSWMQMKVALAS